MNKFTLPIVMLITFFSGIHLNGQSPTKNSSLQFLDSIPLPNITGRLDHMAFDEKHQLVFITAVNYNSVVVVDLKNKTMYHTITGLRKPHGVVYIPQSNSIVVTSGANGACDVFDALTFQKKLTIQLSSDADNIRYDSTAQKIYVGYGSGGIAIIDARSFKLMQEIKLTGHPESFQIDRSTNRLYVNVPDTRKIEIIDLEKNRVTAQWDMTEAQSNFPMSLDETNHRLFIGCRYPPKLLILDAENGKQIASIDTEKDVDDIYFDKARKQIYLSYGSGFVDVFKMNTSGSYKRTDKIITGLMARTSLFIPELNQFIVASPMGTNRPAFLLVYHID